MDKNKQAKAPIKETISLSLKGYKVINKEIPWLLPVSAMYAFFRAITPYVGIFIAAQLINEIAGNRDPERLRFYALAALISAALLSAFIHVTNRLSDYLCTGYWYKVKNVSASKMLTMHFSTMEDDKTHEMLSYLGHHQNWMGLGLSRLLFPWHTFFKSTFGIIGAITLTVSLFTLQVLEEAESVALLNHPIAVVITIALLSATTIIAPFFTTLSQSILTAYDGTLGNRIFSAFGFCGEKISKAMDVRMYRQDKVTSAYIYEHSMNGMWGRNGPIVKGLKGKYGVYNSLSSVVTHIFTGLVYVFVCLKAWGGAFGVGSVTQYIGAISTLSQNIGDLLKSLGTMRQNAVVLRTQFALLELPDDMYQGTLTTEKRSDNKYEIQFRNVSFKYPGSKESDPYILKNISLTFNVGQRLAIVGQNGSGKTTFIKLLCRLYDPTEGEILLNGIDIKKYDYQQYMNIFSAVFQDFELLSYTIGQNVAAAEHYDPEKATDCLVRAGFGDRLATLEKGLDTYINKDIEKDGVDVSGGEAQKIAMARALYREAPFIILDEPTAALDPVAEYEIYSKMNDIVGTKTAVFISHRLSSCRFCQDIAVFHQGELVQRGNHENLVAQANGKYHELWHAQAQYYN